MERVAMFATLVCSLILLSLQHSAQGARMLSARAQGEFPPCTFHWQIPGWDCYDPPQKPLPPCDFKHQSPGIDCWPRDTPAAADVTDMIHATSTTPVAASSAQNAHTEQWPELPPCNFPGAIPGWDCFDPPKTLLPPCDFNHQRGSFDCWPRSPPAAKVPVVTDDSAAGGASTHDVQSTTTHESGAHLVQGMLPPCKDVPGGIPGWDCFDPPTTPLPPCDFHHQRAGFDCWPRSPPAPKMSKVTGISAETSPSTTLAQSAHDQKTADRSAHRVEGMLPPCKDVWGGIPGWDCFDPPTSPLPPCDFHHQRAGFDCWPRDPPAARP